MSCQNTHPNFICTPITQAVMAALLTMSIIASAQAQGDAGTFRQQIEQGQTPDLPRKVLPAKPQEPAQLKALEGTTVTVKTFHFAGNTLLSEGQLALVAATYLNRPLNLAELNKAAAAVADAYRRAGWVVRAYLPKQDIQDGSVTIQIVEAVFGGAVIDGAPNRLSISKALGMIDAAQSKGEKINADDIDRVLLLLGDLPGIDATGNLRAGKNEGETELALKLTDEPLVRFEVGADNAGSRATGSARMLANLALNSPLGLGDLVSANYLHTDGSDYLRAGYTQPVGLGGWRAGVNGSVLNYRLVSPEYEDLNGKGSTDSIGLEASYPIIRSRLRNLYLQLNHDRKTFDNEANGATTSRYRLNATSIGLFGNLFDNWGGGGANIASLTYTSGDLNLNGSPTQATDAITTQADGHYDKWRYALSRQQVISNNVSLYAALSGQWTPDNLDSSEKFYLGGVNGVRAYPSSEAGGSQGQLINIELRGKLPHGFTLTPFYDWGRVLVNTNNNYIGAANPNTISLKGFGLALGWQGDTGLSAKLTWAHRQGSNPNPTATGNDQDGSHIKDRLWANVMLPF